MESIEHGSYTVQHSNRYVGNATYDYPVPPVEFGCVMSVARLVDAVSLPISETADVTVRKRRAFHIGVGEGPTTLAEDSASIL